MNFREVGHLLDPSAEGSLPRLNLSVQSMFIVSLPGLDLGAQSTLIMRTMSFEEKWEKPWAVVEGKEISRHLYITVHPSEEKTSSRSSQLTSKSLKTPPFTPSLHSKHLPPPIPQSLDQIPHHAIHDFQRRQACYHRSSRTSRRCSSHF